MARWLLPVVIVLPIAIAWPRLRGEHLGWYQTEAGLAITATTTVAAFTVIIWLIARRLNTPSW